MIIFDNVTKNYDSNVGLANATVRIKKGEFVFLVGPSGAGKSTFIKLILREINADSGSIIVDGREVTKLSNREIPEHRRHIGIVWQDFRLLPKKTVFENVAFAMEIVHKSRRQIRKRVPQVLSLVGIGDKADKYPNELSAGEQQRVAIARAIINNPTVLIADEPTGNLDPDTATEIMELLDQINITGTTILMVTHAKEIVDRMQKRVIAIEEGHIVRDEFGQYGFDESNGEEMSNSDAEKGSEEEKASDKETNSGKEETSEKEKNSDKKKNSDKEKRRKKSKWKSEKKSRKEQAEAANDPMPEATESSDESADKSESEENKGKNAEEIKSTDKAETVENANETETVENTEIVENTETVESAENPFDISMKISSFADLIDDLNREKEIYKKRRDKQAEEVHTDGQN